MLISELALKAGLSVHTIRYYEKEGLLDESHCYRHANNYRHYHEAALTRLLLVKHGQSAGFTLHEIRHLVTVWESGELSAEYKSTVIRAKIADIEQRLTQLSEMHSYLTTKLARLEAGLDDEEAILAQVLGQVAQTG